MQRKVRVILLSVLLVFLVLFLVSCSSSKKVKFRGTIKEAHPIYGIYFRKIIKVEKVLNSPSVSDDLGLHSGDTISTKMGPLSCDNTCVSPHTDDKGQCDDPKLQKGDKVEVVGKYVIPEGDKPFVDLCPEDNYYIELLK